MIPNNASSNSYRGTLYLPFFPAFSFSSPSLEKHSVQHSPLSRAGQLSDEEINSAKSSVKVERSSGAISERLGANQPALKKERADGEDDATSDVFEDSEDYLEQSEDENEEGCSCTCTGST